MTGTTESLWLRCENRQQVRVLSRVPLGEGLHSLSQLPDLQPETRSSELCHHFECAYNMVIVKYWRVILALSLVLLFVGCGTSTRDCLFGSLNVTPPAASADHTAPVPGNSQSFLAWGSNLSPGCGATASNLLNVTWSVSDSTNVTISNAPDSTFGTTTCVHSTPTPITVTATLPASSNKGRQVTGTATLMCN